MKTLSPLTFKMYFCEADSQNMYTKKNKQIFLLFLLNFKASSIVGIMERGISFAPLRPADFVNFAGRAGARPAFRGAGRSSLVSSGEQV